ncbi:unnamed protein product [Alopecurus aequalis]
MAAASPNSAPRPPGVSAEAKNGAAGLLSPRFRSVAELAGWDEESILLAALVVEDTPVRESRRKRRPSSASAGGSAGSNTRKRRSWRQSPAEIPIPPVTLVLDEEEDDKPKNPPADAKKEEIKEEEQNKVSAPEGKETSGSAKDAVATGELLPCMDKLREELSCAICLDICFEPSTTPCGHSFCMQCLKHAASKCGKRCPKCRQLISNSRSCTINTVLWNTIQLLFPSEVEARRTSIASSSATMDDDVKQTVPRSNSFPQGGTRSRNTSSSSIVHDSTRVSNTSRSYVTPGSRRSMNTSGGSLNTRDRSTRSRDSSSRSFVQASQLVATTTRRSSGQSDDSALAYRLQQEEFMTAFETEDGGERQPQNAVSTARANLRAMASRAVRLHAETEDGGERQPQNAVSTARANLRAMASRAVRLRARGWPL